MASYTEDHLVEQPAIQLMQHELGWDVVNCYDEWSGGVSNQGRDGKREVGGNIEHRTPNIEHRSEERMKSRTKSAAQRLNPDLPVEAIEGAVEEICRDRTALSLVVANREVDKLCWPSGLVLFALEQDRLRNRLKMNEFLFDLKTSARAMNGSSKLAIPLAIFHNPVATHEDT
jgi:hypothetical protein